MTEGPKLTPTYVDLVTAGQAPQPQVSPMLAQPRPPIRERVAIIGTAPSSRSLAPFQDLSWDIWGCSPGNMGQVPRVDAWFEIHANLLWPEIADAYGKNYLAWLGTQQFPIYMQDESWHPKYLPQAIRFPMRELVEKFGVYWFSSSFAWMMAYAIHLGHYKEIALFGVDMASKDEYVQQRQAFYRWLEYAADKGIKVTIPSESDLAQPPGLYGFSDAMPYGRKLHARASELKGRSDAMGIEIQKLTQAIEQQKANKFYIDGAREDNEYQQSIWISLANQLMAGKITLETAIEMVKAAGFEVSKPAPVPPTQQALAVPYPFGSVMQQALQPPITTPVTEVPVVELKSKRKSNGQRRADHG